MNYEDVDKIKPLDRLFEEQIRDFERGSDSISDKELDRMMRELGGYESESRPRRRRI